MKSIAAATMRTISAALRPALKLPWARTTSIEKRPAARWAARRAFPIESTVGESDEARAAASIVRRQPARGGERPQRPVEAGFTCTAVILVRLDAQLFRRRDAPGDVFRRQRVAIPHDDGPDGPAPGRRAHPRA